MMFVLDPKLESDSIYIIDLTLCQIRLSNQTAVPWIILVPKIQAPEIHLLPEEQQTVFWRETLICASLIKRLYSPDKINIGALGNIVPQLHMHVVGRFKTDAAWPGPVWGALCASPYAQVDLEKQIDRIRKGLEDHAHF